MLFAKTESQPAVTRKQVLGARRKRGCGVGDRYGTRVANAGAVYGGWGRCVYHLLEAVVRDTRRRGQGVG